jgi:hypothetical protein
MPAASLTGLSTIQRMATLVSTIVTPTTAMACPVRRSASPALRRSPMEHPPRPVCAARQLPPRDHRELRRRHDTRHARGGRRPPAWATRRPVLGISAEVGLVLFFLGAIAVHLRAHEHHHIITTVGCFLLAAASLVPSIESHEAKVRTASNQGEVLDVATGLPVSMLNNARADGRGISWFEFACAYFDSKWEEPLSSDPARQDHRQLSAGRGRARRANIRICKQRS